MYGDSGSGKSSFIKYLNGVDENERPPMVGGNGESVTKEPGTIYTAEVVNIFIRSLTEKNYI